MNHTFSENLKKIRKDHHLSQEQLADELGVSRQAISKWESAVAYPEMDKILTLCEKFNVNIDDLLHKDIREIKGEEESKKKLNQYVDDFLGFITNTINMFCNMSFKSKCKCLLEQCIIGTILFLICLLVGLVGDHLLSEILSLLPGAVFSVLLSTFYLVFVAFSALSSLVILVHIFKTRYLDYYLQVKNDSPQEVWEDQPEDQTEPLQEGKPKKLFFQHKENKIVIRDPKHSEYKFIHGLSKGIVGIVKFVALCLATILFVALVGLTAAFVISFLIAKTELFFVGTVLAVLSATGITLLLLLILLNFVFNRKNNKKQMIWSFLISLIVFGMGCGLAVTGTLGFEYIQDDKAFLKTEYIELDMKDDLIFSSYPQVEYVASNNGNLRIECTINELCQVKYSCLSDSVVQLWSEYDDPIKIVKKAISNFNDKKIVEIDDEIYEVKIYTTPENIEILKKNAKTYTDTEIQMQNMINSYESRINELEQQVDGYVQKEWEYTEEIKNLKDQLLVYQNDVE